MILHRRSIDFKKMFKLLPKNIQKLAQEQFILLKQNSNHPSLKFKKLSGTKYYSVRVNDNYRAVGVSMPKDPFLIVWVYIGAHDTYEKVIK